MKKLFAIISLFALVFASCEKEETMPSGSGLDILTATMESAADTKAALQDGANNKSVIWESSDYISVFVKTSDNQVKNIKYQLYSGEGTDQGIFKKSEDIDLTGATVLAAAYPYTQGATYSEGTISGLDLPAAYTIPTGFAEYVPEFPMVAKATGTILAFKNAGALVKIPASNIPDGYNIIELSSATDNLSGSYSVTMDDNGIPATVLSGSSKSISFTGTGTDQTLYFPILAGTYSDLTVKAKGQGKTDITLVAPKALTALRSTIHSINNSEVALMQAIAAGGTVTLADAVNLSGTITISNDLILDLGGKVLTIKGNISYGLINKANLTIKNGTIIFEGDGSNGAAVCNMNQITMENANITSNTVCFRNWGDAGVKKLEGKTVADAKVSATINGGTFNSTFINNESHSQHRYAVHGYFLSNMTMTGSTVTGSGGIHVDVSFATLTNVTATAKCTYGAHGLYVAAGNATVSGCTIANAAAYSDDTYGKAVVNGITYENGTTIITEVLAKRDALINVLTDGGTYTLDSEQLIAESLSVPAEKTVVLDLGNKTLTIKGSKIAYGLINKGNLTIKNGTIIFEGDGSNGAAVCNMGQITMENANITSNTVCFRNWGDAGVKKLEGKTVADAKVSATINGGTFNSTFINNESHSQHRYAVHGYFLSNMTMTGSTVTGSGGIHVDVSFATLTNVTATANCTYGAHGLYVAAGNATVSGCTIANAAAYSDDTYGKAVVKIGNNESVTYPNGTTVININ